MNIKKCKKSKKLQEIFLEEKSQKNKNLEKIKYLCKICNFNSNNKTNYNKHLLTEKHMNNTNNYTNNNTKEIFTCEYCNDIFNSKTTLWRHTNKCMQEINNYDNNEKIKELENKIEDLEKEKKNLINPTINNNTFNNTINNNLNINIILDEKCKDAIEFTKFIDQIKLSIEDLLYTKQNGYIEGISNVFIKNLKELGPTERPIHCCHEKASTLYIKGNEKWHEDNNRTILDNQINVISKKQLDSIEVWEKLNPNWKNSEKESKIYMELVKKTIGDNNTNNNKKIQKNIEKQVNIKDLNI